MFLAVFSVDDDQLINELDLKHAFAVWKVSIMGNFHSKNATLNKEYASQIIVANCKKSIKKHSRLSFSNERPKMCENVHKWFKLAVPVWH